MPAPIQPPLGGLALETFMRRHWQRRPLLVRQALPHLEPPLSRNALFELATHDDVESRLVTRRDSGWTLRRGPFPRRALPPRSRPGWTLLVQGVDLHVQAAHELLCRFRIVPDARLDDCMISYASDGGGVGPHVDSYDVFLLQVEGRRRWRVGPVRSPRLQPGLPLKILERFEPQDDWVLEPGDLLYVPPGWGHDGIAVGECMTCSIGYRAPGRRELGAALLQRWLDHLDLPARDRLYRDPPGSATTSPGAIPTALQDFAEEALSELLADPVRRREAVTVGLGEWLTEPKPTTVFEGAARVSVTGLHGRAVALDRRSRMMYDNRCCYLNGEAMEVRGRDARLMRELSDTRALAADRVAKLSASAKEVLARWIEEGSIRLLPTGAA